MDAGSWGTSPACTMPTQNSCGVQSILLVLAKVVPTIVLGIRIRLKGLPEVLSPHALLLGLRAILPILLGVIPFGMISGVAAVGEGFSADVGMGLSLLIYAGASQLATLQLLSTGATLATTLLTALMINLRFVMYSASLAPHLSQLPLHWRCLAAYLVTDPAYAVSITFYDLHHPQPEEKVGYYLGAALGVWLGWQLSTGLGVLVGQQVPEEWSLEFTIPLMFLSVVVPAIKDGPTLVAALTAGILSVVAADLPYNSGLILASLIGIGLGTWGEVRGHESQ